MNLARLEFASLRLVVLCAESGSLSRAANRAALSISGASHRLRCLEDLLGQKIFLRSPRGMVPTEFGRAIVVASQRIIDSAHELVELARPTSPSWSAGVSKGHTAMVQMVRNAASSTSRTH